MAIVEKTSYEVTVRIPNTNSEKGVEVLPNSLGIVSGNLSEYKWETYLVVGSSIVKILKHFGEDNIENISVRGKGIYIS